MLSLLAQSAAADCTGSSMVDQEINVTSGVYSERAVATVPMKIRIPVAIDTGMEAECLRAADQDAESRMTAEASRARSCGDQARQVRLTHAANGAIASIGSALDTASYSNCLDGGVDVEVLPDP